LDRFEKDFKHQDREVYTEHVQKFSKAAFIERMRSVIEERKKI